MKIRNRLAIIFTLLATFILLIVNFLVYYSSSNFRKNDFFNRLRERVKITEQLFLEKDNLSDGMYEEIRKKFLHTLPEEIEMVKTVEELKSNKNDLSEYQLPQLFLKELIKNDSAVFNEGVKQGVGKIYRVKQEEYAVIVIATDQHGIIYTKKFAGLLLAGLLTSVVFIFLSGRLFAKQALRPIAMKIKKASTISASNLHQRLIVYNEKDELGQLALTINALLDRLEHAFETQKNFVGNASHELLNPLTSIIGEADVVLSKEREVEDYKKSIRNIVKEADRLNELVNQFLNLSKTEFKDVEGNKLPIRIDEILLEAKASIDDINSDNQIIFDFSGLPKDDKLLIIRGNVQLIKISLINLLNNACKFSNNKKVTAKIISTKGFVKVTIEDLGIGIPYEELSKVYQPLYRAKNARSKKGSGIGLSLVKKIVELHKGIIQIDSRENEYTKVSLTFPVFNF